MKDNELDNLLKIALSSEDMPSVDLNKKLKDKLIEKREVKVWWIPILGNLLWTLMGTILIRVININFIKNYIEILIITMGLINIILLALIIFNKDLRKRMVIEI